MRIRIVKNIAIDPAGDITEFIGRTFHAEPIAGTDKVNVDFGFRKGTMTIYPSEFEVVDVAEELDDFIKKYFDGDNPVDRFNVKEFILNYRVGLVKILRL